MDKAKNYRNPNLPEKSQLKGRQFSALEKSWLFGVPVLILISGKAGAGKTTSANILYSLFRDSEYTTLVGKDAFARGVKDVATEMGWDGKKDERGRILLQEVGKLGRFYNPDVWVEKTIEMGNILASPLIIEDWRFPNEYDYCSRFIGERNIYTLRIYAPSREILKDSPAYYDTSETSLKEYDFYDFVVNNENSMDDLGEELKLVYRKIIEDRVRYETSKV